PFADGVEALFHADGKFTLLRFGEFALIPRLSRRDTDRCQLRSNVFVLRILGSELQEESEILRELELERFFAIERRPFDRRSRSRCGLLQVSGKRLNDVSLLDLFHVRHVRRIEELRAEDRQSELGLNRKRFLDSAGSLALPVRAENHVAAAIV